MHDQARNSTLDVLTIEQCAARLDVDIATIYRWRKHEGLPYSKVGRRVFFRAASVDRWMQDREKVDQTEPVDEAPRRKRRAHL